MNNLLRELGKAAKQGIAGLYKRTIVKLPLSAEYLTLTAILIGIDAYHQSTGTIDRLGEFYIQFLKLIEAFLCIECR
jgi:hypothetical protein